MSYRPQDSSLSLTNSRCFITKSFVSLLSLFETHFICNVMHLTLLCCGHCVKTISYFVNEDQFFTVDFVHVFRNIWIFFPKFIYFGLVSFTSLYLKTGVSRRGKQLPQIIFNPRCCQLTLSVDARTPVVTPSRRHTRTPGEDGPPHRQGLH